MVRLHPKWLRPDKKISHESGKPGQTFSGPNDQKKTTIVTQLLRQKLQGSHNLPSSLTMDDTIEEGYVFVDSNERTIYYDQLAACTKVVKLEPGETIIFR